MMIVSAGNAWLLIVNDTSWQPLVSCNITYNNIGFKLDTNNNLLPEIDLWIVKGNHHLFSY